MKYLIQNEWWEIDKEYNLDKLLYLLIDRPDEINKIGNFVWNNRNYDLPAVVFSNGNIFWY